VRETIVVLDDPSVHVTGHGARTLAFSMTRDLMLELRVLRLELEARVLELLLPPSYLL
jgi:hypothetical protein